MTQAAQPLDRVPHQVRVEYDQAWRDYERACIRAGNGERTAAVFAYKQAQAAQARLDAALKVAAQELKAQQNRKKAKAASGK